MQTINRSHPAHRMTLQATMLKPPRQDLIPGSPVLLVAARGTDEGAVTISFLINMLISGVQPRRKSGTTRRMATVSALVLESRHRTETSILCRRRLVRYLVVPRSCATS